MNWLNLEIRTLRSPAYIGSDPTERATWISILAFCCEQENGGRVVGAKAWKDRKWQQMCAVTRREVMRATNLLQWDGDDLIVTGYPLDKEAEVQAMRAIGSTKTDKKALAARENGALGGRPKTQRETQREETQDNPTETHRKEGEGKGKEGEGNSTFCAESEEPTSTPEKEPILIFPCDGPKKTWRLTEEKLAEWQEAYPSMDVAACVRDAKQWAVDNPQKRKTANGMTRFLGGWISRAQNKGEHRRATPAQEIAYWESPHPDAKRPQDELLREAFRENWGDNPAAAGILEKIEGMKNGGPAPP